MAFPSIYGGGRGGGVISRSLAVQVIASRWFMVFGTILIMVASGATNTFGLYSRDIKQALGYDQTTLNRLSFFKDLGANVGGLSGFIIQVTQPWVVLSTGAILNFFGYFMIWLAVTKRTSGVRVWHMCLYICIGANSQSFANTGALITAVKNFPESRGVVLGLLNGFIELSGAIITQLHHAVYHNDSQSLILMIGCLPSVISILFLGTIRNMQVVRIQHELKVFYRLLYMSFGLAGFLMVIIIFQNRYNFAQVEYGVSAAVVVLLLFLPLAVVVHEELEMRRTKRRALEQSPSNLHVVTQQPNTGEAPLNLATATAEPETAPGSIPNDALETEEPSCWTVVFRAPSRGEDFTILQALFSLDMLILIVATSCGVGGTLTAIDNMQQIGNSLGYPKGTISTIVSLVSIWNYLGRVVAGFYSEHILRKYQFPRTLVLTLVIVVSCFGHLLIAFGVPNGLYFASIIIGFCFGAQWLLLYAIISEIFGLKHYSTLYNFGSVASPIGSYLLNVRVAGHLYDREAERQLRALGLVRMPWEDLNCNGVECFKLAFIIITVVTLFGALVSVILVIRTRQFYKSDIYKKFREEVNAAEREIELAGSGIAAPEDGVEA